MDRGGDRAGHWRRPLFRGIASTAIILIILAGVKPLEEAYLARNQSFQFHIRAERGKLTPDVLKTTLGIRSGQVKRFITQGSGKKNDEEAVQALISHISSEQAAGFGRKLRRSLSFATSKRKVAQESSQKARAGRTIQGLMRLILEPSRLRLYIRPV